MATWEDRQALRGRLPQRPKLTLARALRLPHPARLALVGAGGKTTALFRLAGELGGPVILTTTTHLASFQAAGAHQHIVVERAEQIDGLVGQLSAGVTLVTGPAGADDRLTGLDEAALTRLYHLVEQQGIPLLVEADGARMRPLKAPAAHEPAMPPFVQQVVVLAGLSALGQPLDERTVHRVEHFARCTGLSPGEVIQPDHLARLLTHPEGGLKGIPPGATARVLLNQGDDPQRQAAARRIAPELLHHYAGVVIAAMRAENAAGLLGDAILPADAVRAVHERLAGVVLAAGEAQRFGQPKQLLLWQGEPFVRHVAKTALAAGMDPVVVVVGANAGQVAATVSDLPIVVAENPVWQQGQSTSVICGLQRLPPETGGAIFFLADQPQIPPFLVKTLLEVHAASLMPLVAPQVEGRRANPVLFDRETFPQLLALEGDTGGRLLFSRYPVEWVPWHDPRLLLDVDTPEDYRRLLDA